MIEKKEKKLRLEKVTVQNFNWVLDGDQQNAVKGGTNTNQNGLTDIPVVCIPRFTSLEDERLH